jgi:hypothetical protein
MELQAGVWSVIRADFPLDAFGHMRHKHAGVPCPDQEYGGCPVEELGEGSWAETVQLLRNEDTTLQPDVYLPFCVPRRPYPDQVGY